MLVAYVDFGYILWLTIDKFGNRYQNLFEVADKDEVFQGFMAKDVAAAAENKINDLWQL